MPADGGIVKKNAIMVIDVALDLERRESRSPTTPSTRPACDGCGPS
jgi:hypothetical protein